VVILRKAASFGAVPLFLRDHMALYKRRAGGLGEWDFSVHENFIGKVILRDTRARWIGQLVGIRFLISLNSIKSNKRYMLAVTFAL
jgi:hypothetical protein